MWLSVDFNPFCNMDFRIQGSLVHITSSLALRFLYKSASQHLLLTRCLGFHSLQILMFLMVFCIVIKAT